MTRKTALKRAINIVNNSDLKTDEKSEIISKLELCLSELPFAKWTKEAIFDACDQYIEENGELHINAFNRAGLPSHPTVKNRFGMTVLAFRDKYYPKFKPLVSNSPYRYTSVESVTQSFKNEFNRIEAKDRQDYDRRRDKSLPCAQTLLKLTGFKGWDDLLEACELDKYKRVKPESEYTSSFTMRYQSMLAELNRSDQDKEDSN